jgi:glycosyltransferase involved in cell wall biosynthesis
MVQAEADRLRKFVDLNVLHVRSTIGMYGAEKVILNLMGAFKGLASSMQVSSSVALIEGANDQSKNLASLLKKQGSDSESIVSKKRLDFVAIKKLHSIIKHNRINVIHTHDYKSLLFIILATLFSNKIIIHHIHGTLGNTRAERIYAFIERICMARVDQIITVSQKQKKILMAYRYLKNKVIQVNNGTVLPAHSVLKNNQYLCAPKNLFTIIMVARLTPEKNHQLAIDVLNELIRKKTRNQVKLLLLGDGPNLEAIKNQVKEYSLQDSIQLIGFSNDVQSWLEKSDLLLITSTTEGMPMCLLEAMAIGLPTVSSPVGEIPHILTESKSGLLANKKILLAESIITLMEDKNLYQEFSRNARTYSEKHLSVQGQAQVLAGIYQRLNSKNGSICT